MSTPLSVLRQRWIVQLGSKEYLIRNRIEVSKPDFEFIDVLQ